MATNARTFRDALSEVQRAAHIQDLVEVPKMSVLDRETEQLMAIQPLAFPEPVAVPEKK